MKLLYSKEWTKTELGSAIITAIGWQHAVPRVGNLFSGSTIPIPDGGPVPLIEAVEDSAKDLLNRYKTLYVPWSGGIDSTLVAVALAHFKTPEHTIIISESDQSMTDSPSGIYKLLIEKGCVGEPFDIERMKEISANGGMVVSGYHADSIMIGEMADARELHDVIHDMTPVELLMAHTGLSEARCKTLLRQLEPLLSLMPVERTAANIAWWLDFTCCWSRDEYDLHFRLGLPKGSYASFFMTDLFQRWSMQDTRKKGGLTEATKKYKYKDILESYLGVKVSNFKSNLIDFNLTIDNDLFSDKLLLIREDYSYIKSI